MISKTKHRGDTLLGLKPTLLAVDNCHVESCGTPPNLHVDGKYIGYLENPYGEQWVFIGSGKSNTAQVYGGDVGWEKPFKLTLKNPCPDAILNESEKLWIILCFATMSGKPFEDVRNNYNKTAAHLAAEAISQLKKKR